MVFERRIVAPARQFELSGDPRGVAARLVIRPCQSSASTMALCFLRRPLRIVHHRAASDLKFRENSGLCNGTDGVPTPSRSGPPSNIPPEPLGGPPPPADIGRPRGFDFGNYNRRYFDSCGFAFAGRMTDRECRYPPGNHRAPTTLTPRTPTSPDSKRPRCRPFRARLAWPLNSTRRRPNAIAMSRLATDISDDGARQQWGQCFS